MIGADAIAESSHFIQRRSTRISVIKTMVTPSFWKVRTQKRSLRGELRGEGQGELRGELRGEGQGELQGELQGIGDRGEGETSEFASLWGADAGCGRDARDPGVRLFCMGARGLGLSSFSRLKK